MCSCFPAVGNAAGTEADPYEFVGLKNISGEQAKQYLTGIADVTITRYPNMPTILVSGEQPELARALTVLDLVDSPEQFVMKEILPVSAARNMPSNDQIAAKLHPSLTRGVSIGNFSNPPRKDASARALIDIHDGAVVAIAPVKLLERIESIVGPLAGKSGPDEQQTPEVQKGSQALAKRQVLGAIEPIESKFVFAAEGAAKATPKAQPAKALPGDSGAKAQPETAGAEAESGIVDAAKESDVGAARTRPGEGVMAATQEATTTNTAEPLASESIPNPDEIVNLALADFEKLTIVQFLGLVGPYLHLDFLYNPELLKKEFAINPNGKWRGPIKVGDLYPMLEDVLKFNKLAMTRSSGNLVTIVPVEEAIEIDPPLVDSGREAIDRGNGVVTRVFDLEHTDTTSATNLLTSMRLTVVPPIPKGRSLIVTGYAHRMPRIETLLRIIDEPGEVKKFRFRQLRYTMAETLAPKLQVLAEQLGTVSITVTETSEPTTTTPATTTRRPGETTQQYETRRRTEAAARARALAAARARGTTTGTTTQPEMEETTVYLDSDKRTNRILMIGLPEKLDEVEELIDTLDVAQQDLRTLELYKIEHIDAEEVRNKLEELGIIRPRMRTSSYSSRITGAKPSTTTTGTTVTPRPTTTGQTEYYDETEEAPGEEPQIVVVEQTNSLLVNATAEQHEKVARILSYIDSEMLAKDVPVQLYPLENQSPEHLAGVLEKLIEETVLNEEGKIVDKISKQDEQIIIVPEPNTFSLIVYANKKNQDWISNIINNLDKRRPQVLIDVTLVQISKVDTFEYDLNILSSFPDLAEGVSGATVGSAPVVSEMVSALLNADRDRFIDFRSSGGSGQAFYGDKHINALLTALETKSYGRVLAKPKILVNDNEPGLIKQVKTTYIERTGSTLLEGNSVGVQTSQEFEGYEEGITLEITPHISSGDLLRLDVLLTRADFAEGGPSEKPPDIENNDIDTTVTVPDGSTIILGGLTKLDQNKNRRKVPLLGDLPIVGGLFRSTDNTDRGENMYVFVKAEIIRPSESGFAQGDLERISQRNRAAFEEHETKFQQDQDWPGIKSKPMQPLRVLDAQ